MELKYYGPVLILTLNRYAHFKRCIESLQKCTHSRNTDLYIGLDYPLNDSHWDGYRKTNEYVKSLSGFKSVTTIRRIENYGVQRNFYDMQNYIFEKYDRIIFSEDDNEFSPNFLDFINKGLVKYDNDGRVSAICGYSFPIGIPKAYLHDYYYHQRFSGWGYGTWKKKVPDDTEWNIYQLKEFLSNKQYATELKTKFQRHYYRVLDAIENKDKIYGDGLAILLNIKNNTYSVYPTISKVKNHGHDGSGINCGFIDDDIYSAQEIDTNVEFDYSSDAPLVDTAIDNIYSLALKLTLLARIKKSIKHTIIGKIFTYLKERIN
jgi:hypothetical protein